MPARPIDITILICTRNRDRLLGETLDSLAQLRVPEPWHCEVLIVDNGSTDRTRATVLGRVAKFTLPLRYLCEATPGKSSAMNAGITASTAEIIACTDDDVRVSRDWLTAACTPLRGPNPYAYAGGPVRPMWDGPCPAWFPR